MTAAVVGGGAPPRLDMGKTVNSTLKVLLARSLDLLVIGLPFVFLPNALVELLPPDLRVFRLAAGLPSLIFIGAGSLLAYREMTGGPRVGIGEAISAGARKFASLWGVGLISNIGAALGLLLLIVPGVVLASSLAAASSAVMVEGMTTTAAIDRAWRLSEGSRWRLAGLLAITFLAIAVLLLLVGIAGAVLALTLGPDTGVAVGQALVAPLYTVIMMALMTVGSTAVYVGLRQAREGAPGVADVFV